MAPRARSRDPRSPTRCSVRSSGRLLAVTALLAACGTAEPQGAPRVAYDLVKRFAASGGGETTTLALADRAVRPRLVRGWSDPDVLPSGESVVTATQRFATLRLEVANPNDRTLTVRARRWGPPDARPAGVAVLVNHRRIGVIRVGPELADYPVPVPPHTLHPGRNEVTFSGPPRRRGEASGVAYHSIELEGFVARGAPRLAGDAIVLGAPATLRYVLRVPPAAVLAFGADPSRAVSVTVEREDGRTAPVTLRAAGDRVTGDLSAWHDQMIRLSIAYAGGPTPLQLRAPRILVPPAAEDAAPGVPVRPRTNVLVYLIDTLRADHLGCYGYARPTSPTMDALAAEGVLFEETLAQASWTRPATASLLTGVDPPVHGAMSIRDGLRPEVPTLAGTLAAAGYATAAFVTNVNVAGRWGFANGFDSYEYLPEDENSDTVHVRSDVLSQRAADWLAHADPARPFLLYVHATDPHAPYNPPADVARAFAPDGRCGAEARDTLVRVKRDPDAAMPADLDRLRACYDGEIAFTDRSLGQLLDQLRRLGRLDDTLVVVTADHGEEFFEHHGFEHGRTLFGELLHVPLVMRFPEPGLRGRRITARARQIDVMPTVLEYVGVPIPAEVRGRSLLADVAHPADAPAVESYAHTRLGGRDLQAITTGRWKVIEGEPGRGLPLRIYDLTIDAGESHDVARENPLLGDYAREALSTWLADLPLGTDPAAGPSRPAQADPEMLQRLRALGYVE